MHSTVGVRVDRTKVKDRRRTGVGRRRYFQGVSSLPVHFFPGLSGHEEGATHQKMRRTAQREDSYVNNACAMSEKTRAGERTVGAPLTAALPVPGPTHGRKPPLRNLRIPPACLSSSPPPSSPLPRTPSSGTLRVWTPTRPRRTPSPITDTYLTQKYGHVSESERRKTGGTFSGRLPRALK